MSIEKEPIVEVKTDQPDEIDVSNIGLDTTASQPPEPERKPFQWSREFTDGRHNEGGTFGPWW